MLSDEDKKLVCELVRLGCTLEKAAAHVGCPSPQLYRLVEQDKVFCHSLRDAERRFEVRNLVHLYQAGEKHWQAAAWLLERRYPDRFSRRPPAVMSLNEVENCLSRFTQIVLDHVPEPDRRRQIELALSELSTMGRRTKEQETHLFPSNPGGCEEIRPKDRE